MANVFKDLPTIVQEMLDKFQTITGVTLSSSQLDDDNVIKAYTYAAGMSGLYAQLQRLANDTFPTAQASISALNSMCSARSISTQIQAQPSHMQIQFTFSAAATVGVGVQVQRVSDGALYQTIQSGSGDATNPVTLFVESLLSGNVYNSDQLNQPFALTQALAGVNTSCQNVSYGLDGRDIETAAEQAARIVAHDQSDNTGGNVVWYQETALAASNEVVTANAIRLNRGPDTVDVVITSGTTNISAAIQAGQPVVRLPSTDLIAVVQAYIASLNPTTDDVLVLAPTESSFDVTFNFSLYTETTANRAYVNGQITQVIQIYLYEALSGSTITPTALERLVDQSVGSYLSQRECLPLGSSTREYVIPNNVILKPGTLTLGTMT